MTKNILPAACAAALCILSLTATAAPEALPSFDCAKARTGAEKRQGDALVVEEQPAGAGSSGPPYCGLNGTPGGTFFPIR